MAGAGNEDERYAGMCLLCNHHHRASQLNVLEDLFFKHFAETHRSGEPIYEILQPDQDNEQ